MTYKLHGYEQTGYGTYRVTIKGDDGKFYSTRTHEVELIEDLRSAGRELKYNDDGSYEAARQRLTEHVVTKLGLE